MNMAVSEIQTGDQWGTDQAGLVASTGITITLQNCVIVGRLVSYAFRFETSSDFSARADLITGFENPYGLTHGTASCILYDNTASPKETFMGYLNMNGILRAQAAIPSGHSIRGCITYIYDAGEHN